MTAESDDDILDGLFDNAETHDGLAGRFPAGLARRRDLRQGLFTEEPWALSGQSGPANDRRDGSGGL